MDPGRGGPGSTAPADDSSGRGAGRKKTVHAHWGRRQRRLRRMALALGLLALAGSAVAVWIVTRGRPETRQPGEVLDDVTSRLDRNLPPEAPTPRFVDATEAAGLGAFRTFAGSRSSQLPEDMGSGLAWGDFDRDGDDDLFLVAAGGALDLPAADRAPSLLFENLGDGTFRRVESFPQIRILGMAAAWGDADGDGRLDLVVTGYDTLLLLRNRETGFVLDETFPSRPGFWAGASWGDFDNDRDLDLYVAGYVRYELREPDPGRSSEQYGAAVPYTLNPVSYEPERNLLFENSGRGSFRELAVELGVDNAAGRSLTALWHDFDADGRLDLYVANDISDNALFLNRAGGFEDASLAAWVADYRGAMGLTAGDWNRDGDDDLFVTHWVAQENALYDSLLAELRSSEGEVAARLGFTDVAAPRGLGQIALRFIGWGTEFGDFDADGWLDLVVANGSTFETGNGAKRLEPQADFLLWNEQGRFFHDLAPLAESLAEERVSRGLALADYDLDGDLDVAIMDHDGGVRLLRNELEGGNWLELRLRSRAGPSGEPLGFGDGATVIAAVGDTRLRRSVTSASYLSQSSRQLHFGLGSATRADRVEVHWLGGEAQVWNGLAGNAAWELVEGEAEARRLDGARSGAAGDAVSAAAIMDERQRRVAFWKHHRAAMDAFKGREDCATAIPLFEAALELDAKHEDARYYLANCLSQEGRVEEAIAELDALRTASPASHRAHKQYGVLKAMHARTAHDLEAAERALLRALEINREETGSLLVLGELALLRGRPSLAEERLALACRTNPRAVGGFFLRAYLAFSAGDRDASVRLLGAAAVARGEGFKPEGAVAEGDVATRMHREATPLSRFWEQWSGSESPEVAFPPLAEHLERQSSSPGGP